LHETRALLGSFAVKAAQNTGLAEKTAKLAQF
jgi:hypothetical protein